MSDTIWVAIITNITALLIVLIKGIFGLKKIKIKTIKGATDTEKSDNLPSANFSKYLWQTQKIPLLIFFLVLLTLIFDFIDSPNPITAYFVFNIAFKFFILASISLSILIFYLVRLVSGLLKEDKQ